MQKTFCITGLDGAGKSTLVKSISQILPSVRTANIWDIMEGGIESIPFRSKLEIDNYLCELTPNSRLLFLSHALKYSIDKAEQSDKEHILLNGYYYKYFASELALGGDISLVNALMDILPKPDITIYLKLDVEKAAQRKSRYSRYESGLSELPDRESFIEFQKKAQLQWDIFDKAGWHNIDAERSVDEILAETIELIKTP